MLPSQTTKRRRSQRIWLRKVSLCSTCRSSIHSARVLSPTIIAIAENAAQNGVNSTEDLLDIRTDERAARSDTSVSSNETTTKLVKQGFLTLYTLPGYITHFTVDIFEV